MSSAIAKPAVYINEVAEVCWGFGMHIRLAVHVQQAPITFRASLGDEQLCDEGQFSNRNNLNHPIGKGPMH